MNSVQDLHMDIMRGFGRLVTEEVCDKFLEGLVENNKIVYVDGEEGDYGTIEYSTSDGQLVCTYVNEGGDTSHMEYTDFGKQAIISYILQQISADLLKSIFD